MLVKGFSAYTNTTKLFKMTTSTPDQLPLPQWPQMPQHGMGRCWASIFRTYERFHYQLQVHARVDRKFVQHVPS
jgi:hypothetical protein